MESASSWPFAVGGHRLAEDGDAEVAGGEIRDGSWGAGLQRDVRSHGRGGACPIEHRPDSRPLGEGDDRACADVGES